MTLVANTTRNIVLDIPPQAVIIGNMVIAVTMLNPLPGYPPSRWMASDANRL